MGSTTDCYTEDGVMYLHAYDVAEGKNECQKEFREEDRS